MVSDFLSYFYEMIEVNMGLPEMYELGWAYFDVIIGIAGYVFALFLLLIPFGIVFKAFHRG